MATPKILGPSLLGFGDFFEQEEFLGAAAVKKATLAPRKGTSTAPVKYGPVRNNPTVQDHGKLLVQAHATLAKTVKSATAAHQAAKTRPTASLKPQAHLGAAAALTPKQKLAVSRHESAKAKTAQAAKTAAAAALKARNTAIELAKKMKSQRAAAVQIRRKAAPKTSVRGIDLLGNDEIGEEVRATLQECYTQLGASPDSNNPGFLDDGSPDPAYAPLSTDPSAAFDPSMLDDGSGIADQDAQLPPAPPMDTHIADFSTYGGIPYDGSRGTPDGFIGSYRFFTHETDKDSGPGRRGWDGASIDWTDHYGFVFGKTDALEHGGDSLQSGTWNHVHGGKGRSNFWESVDTSASTSSASTANPNGVSYGPIVGNPKSGDWKGLRYDDKGNLFWFPQEAPDWATFPLKQAAALTAKAEKDAADAAAKADAARMAKEQADAAEAQAQQDAANALAESQATSAAKVAATQAESDANQALIDQQKATTAQQLVDTQQQQAAGNVMIQQAQQQMAQQQQAQQFMAQLQAAQPQLAMEQADLPADQPGEEYADQPSGYDTPGTGDLDELPQEDDTPDSSLPGEDDFEGGF